MPQPIRRTHNPTLTLYRKYGGLAYRLARAIVGEDAEASSIVASVFEELNPGQGTSWYEILSSVHTRCRAVGAVTGSHPEPSLPDTDAIEGMGFSAQVVYQAYGNLSDQDQRLLWSTLMGSDTDELRLGEALRRLQIAVTNQSIPPGDPGEDGLP